MSQELLSWRLVNNFFNAARPCKHANAPPAVSSSVLLFYLKAVQKCDAESNRPRDLMSQARVRSCQRAWSRFLPAAGVHFSRGGRKHTAGVRLRGGPTEEKPLFLPPSLSFYTNSRWGHTHSRTPLPLPHQSASKVKSLTYCPLILMFFPFFCFLDHLLHFSFIPPLTPHPSLSVLGRETKQWKSYSERKTFYVIASQWKKNGSFPTKKAT